MSKTLEEMIICSFVDFLKSMLERPLIRAIRSNKLPRGKNYTGPIWDFAKKDMLHNLILQLFI